MTEDEELSHLYALRDAMLSQRATTPAAPTPEGQSFFGRLGRNVGNFVSDIPHDVASAITSTVGAFVGEPEILRDETRREIARSQEAFRPFSVPQAREGSWSDAGADLISGLGKTVAEAYLAGAPVTRGASLLGAGRAAPILGDIAGGAFIGAQQSVGEAAGTGTEFGAIGAANQFIPNPWLKAAANIAVPVAGQLMRGHDVTSKESLISTGANVLVPALLGQYARRGERPLMRTATEEPFVMTNHAPEPADDYSPPPSMLSREPIAPDTFTPPAPPVEGMRRTSNTNYDLGGFASSPLTQYLGGASAGAIAGPIINDDPDTPIWQKMLEGGLGGAGLVAGGRGLMRGFDREGRLGMLGVPEGRKWWERPKETPKEFTPDEYARLADERIATKSRTTPTTPTTQEAQAIRNAYNEMRASSDFPAVKIADVLERAGFTPETMDRGRGIVAAMRQSGDLNVSAGDWSASDPRTRAWAIDLLDSTPTNPQEKQLLMRMTDAPPEQTSGGMMRRSGESGSIDFSNPAIQYGTGAAVGGLLGPVIDQDPDHPWQAKVLLGAAGGAALLAGGKALMRSSPATDPVTQSAPTSQSAQQTKAGGLLSRAQEAFPKTTRILQREFGLGNNPSLRRIDTLARGTRDDLTARLEPSVKTLAGATDAERTAIQAYEDAPRSQASEASLRANLRPEIADAYLNAEKISGEAQQVQFDATDDPRKQRLLSDTNETYRTRKYQAYSEPDKWFSNLQKNPQLETDLVDQLVRDNDYPGLSRNEVSLVVRDHIAEIKRGGDPFVNEQGGDKISANLYRKRKDLTPEYRAFLGEYKNPAQRILFTNQKLINEAMQAKKISLISDLGASGELPVLTRAERDAQLKAAMAPGGDKATADRLAALQPIPNVPGYGKLAGKLVGQDVIDSLNAHNELWQGSWLKSFSGLTSFMKGSQTVANPGTHGRQLLQTPLMAAIARVLPQDFYRAWREVKNNPALKEEMVRNGVTGADFSTAELGRSALNLDTLFNPDKTDRAIGAVKKAWEATKTAYGAPDRWIRIAAYIKQRNRYFAEGNAAGLKGDALAKFAQDKAVDFIGRYTMDYSQAPNALKIASSVPFASPYIRYQGEMIRLMKNLGDDAINGSAADRVWALGNVGALIGLPLMVAQFAKSQLSDKDAEDWDRANRLSPAYSGGQIRVPLGRKSDGTFRYLNIGNLVPAGDMAAIARNLANGDFEKLAAGNPYVGFDKSPVLNLAAGLVTGKDPVTDRKFDGAGDYVKFGARQVLPPLTPYIGYEAERLGNAFTRNDKGEFGLTNSRTGRADTPASALLRQVGPALYDVQPAALMRRAQFDLREKESAIKSELNQLLRTNAAPEVKQAARRKALMRLQEAREETRALLR